MHMDQFIEFLQAISWQGSRLGLERMTELMEDVEEGNLDVRAKMKYYDDF